MKRDCRLHKRINPFARSPKCEPALAQAERRGIVGAFDDQEVYDDYEMMERR